MLARDVARDLAYAGEPFGAFGGTGDFAVFVSQEPERRPNVVTVYDTGGPAPKLQAQVVQPSVQVRVKSAEYERGLAVVWEAWRILSETVGVMYGDGYLAHWNAESVPNYIGRAEDDCCLFTANFTWVFTLNQGG